MLIVISPAKTLDFDNPAPTRRFSQPQFQGEALELNALLRSYSSAQLAKLMSISKVLADLNAARNLDWQLPFTPANAKQALFAFRGDVYTGLDADSFGEDELAFAQQHLRILSGLYGLLRPLDLIQPYRLEMGTRLANARGKTLYAYWGDDITTALGKALNEQKDRVLINLASEEYFSAVKPALLEAELVTPVFKDYKSGDYKILSFFAKKARGAMAAWIIRNQLAEVEALKDFSEGGYQFNKGLSKDGNLVFARKQD